MIQVVHCVADLPLQSGGTSRVVRDLTDALSVVDRLSKVVLLTQRRPSSRMIETHPGSRVDPGVVRASGCGGVFPSAERTSLTSLLEQALGKGPVPAAARLSLAGWAECLGGRAGADYLMRILDHADGQPPGSTRPLPPWTMATSAPCIEARDGE